MRRQHAYLVDEGLHCEADAFASFAGLPLEVVDGVAYHCVGDYVVDALRDAEQHKADGGDNELPRRVIATKYITVITTPPKR